MTTEEKERLDRMEQHLRLIKEDLQHISAALIGSPINGNKGLVNDFKELKEEQETLKVKVYELEKDNAKKDVVIDLLKAASFLLSGGLITLAVNMFLRK